MQQMGRGLRAGMKAIAGELIMATPRAGANELRGSVDCVGPAGEDKLIRETCWARVVIEKATVTVTQREKLNGVTETCTRHVETREITNAVTEIKCTETREIEGELDGVKDEHTHTEVVEDNGGELAERFVTRCRQLDGLLRERGEVVCPLEAIHDQVSSVELRGVEGASAVDGCTESLGVWRPRELLW